MGRVSVASVTKIRVRYADTDQMKRAYYGNYFSYFEEGRSELLRRLGLPYPEIEAMGYYLPVAEAQAKYLKPARYDDLLAITAIMEEMPQVRIVIRYEVRLDGSPELLAEGYTVHSFVAIETGRPTRPPRRFLDLLESAFLRGPFQTVTV
jgi:acyl-CoA thioester hydrolase